MDIYFPKTRRPMAVNTSSLKRPLTKPASSIPKLTKELTSTIPGKQQTEVLQKEVEPILNNQQPCTPNKETQTLSTSNSPIYVEVTPSSSKLFPTQQNRPVKRRILEPPGAPKKARQKPAVFRQLFEHSKQKDLPKFRLSSPIRDDKANSSSQTTNSPVKSILRSPIKRKEFTSPLKTKTSTPSTAKIEDGPLKGVSTKLLDFIRAKEAEAKKVTPEIERKRELLGIAQDIARIIPTIFTASKREIISHNKIVEHCCKSLKNNYGTATIEECLILMDTITPEWTTTVTISRGKFIRLNKDKYTIPQLLEAIKRYKQTNC